MIQLIIGNRMVQLALNLHDKLVKKWKQKVIQRSDKHQNPYKEKYTKNDTLVNACIMAFGLCFSMRIICFHS